MEKTFEEYMEGLITEDDTAIFLADAKLFAKKIVYGKWFLPHKHSTVESFEREFGEVFGGVRKPNPNQWVILDTQNVAIDCLKKANLKTIYEIATLSAKYGSEPVRGFRFTFKKAPTTKKFETLFQGVFKNEIEFVYHHLLKTGKIKNLSAKEKQGNRWKKYLFRKRNEMIPFQFTSLPVYVNEVLIFLREGLEK